MPPPVVKKNPSVRTIRTRPPRITKLSTKRTDTPCTSQQRSTIIMSENSASDSDDTIIQQELHKLTNAPPELADFNANAPVLDSEESNEVTSEVSESVEDGELADDEKSALSCSAPESRSTDPSVDSEDNLPTENFVPSSQTTSSSSGAQLIQSVNTVATITPSQPICDNDPSLSKKRLDQADILLQIKETHRLKRAVDKEIKRRKRVLKQQVTDNKRAILKIPPSIASRSVQPQSSSQSKTSTIVARPNSDKAPPNQIVLTTLNPEIVRLAVDKVSKRRRMTNAYSMISEILLIKQMLAKGNPFKVIPQYAYDISHVPGIKLPHIQELLRQWELYFANIFYQIVQIEYSVEYSDIEKRISTMIEGGDKYAELLQFQSFIGKDEVSTTSFKTQSSQPRSFSNTEGPLLKKSKNIVEVAEASGLKQTSEPTEPQSVQGPLVAKQ